MMVVSLRIAAAVFLGLVSQAASQAFDFTDIAVPGARIMQTLYKFHVEGDQYADKSLATVYFKDLRLMPSPDDADAPAPSAVALYTGVQITLMSEDDYNTNLDRQRFCSWQGHFEPIRGQYINYTVVDTKGSYEQDIRKPGAYLLLITNCGTLKGLSVRGFAAVRHPWGFLPAIERASKSLYLMSTLFYVSILLVWTLVCLSWWSQLLPIQKGLLLTMIFCVSESIASWFFFQVRNDTGDFPRSIFLLAALSSIYKLVCSFYTITSNPAKGADGEEGLSLSMHCLLMVFLVFQFHLKVIESLRHGFGIAGYVVMLSALPVVIVGGILLFLAFQRTSEFVEMLETEKDADLKVKLYKRLKGLILFAAAGSTISVFLSVFDPTTGTMSSWSYHPIVSDALPQGIFACILAVLTVISFPSNELQGYSYSQTDGGMETGAIGAPASIWDDDEDEESAPVKGPHKLVAAE